MAYQSASYILCGHAGVRRPGLVPTMHPYNCRYMCICFSIHIYPIVLYLSIKYLVLQYPPFLFLGKGIDKLFRLLSGFALFCLGNGICCGFARCVDFACVISNPSGARFFSIYQVVVTVADLILERNQSAMFR